LLQNGLRKEVCDENLTRFEPLFTEPFEDMFRQCSSRCVSSSKGCRRTSGLTCRRATPAYTVKADLPGVKKDDIRVEIDGNLVTISAEVGKRRK